MYRPEYDDQPEMPSQGGIVAAFADDAIIFEDRYETAPDVFVERRSTSTRLNVCVNGGMNGGMYSVSVANSSKLVFKSGEQLPVQRYVEPGQCLRFYSEYEGCAASSSVNDITVSAMFVDDVTGFTITSSDSITILKVEFRADQQALENICPHRHRLAIGESVVCSWQPSGEQVNFNVELKNGLYVCPLVETNNMLTVMYAGVTYEPNLEVIEPSSVVGVNARCGHYGISAGRPGWVALRQYFKLLPLDVNFYGIAIQEVPSFIGFHSGYFADDTFSDDWYHLERQGAGNWIRMSMTNVAEYVDTASSRREFLRVRPDGSLTSDENYPWSDGVIYWGIPIGWNYRTCASNDPPVAVMRDLVEQEFVIEQDGDFAIRKLGNEALRTIDGRLYLNGMEVYVR